MTVRLFLTCLADGFWGDVGIATARVLEAAGCTVEFDERQTCCGQPAFNKGDWPVAKAMLDRAVDLMPGDVPVVVPSASCAAMFHDGAHLLGSGLAPVRELSQFLWHDLQVREWPSLQTPVRAAFHRSCHGRMLGLTDEAESLLGLIGGLTIEPLADAEQCCGFGGAFSVEHSTVSARIGDAKLDRLVETGSTTVIGGDAGCLVHLDGLSRRQGRDLRFRHWVELMAEAVCD